MLAGIRAFFCAREVLEVDTPSMSIAGNTDPAIESFRANGARTQYLLHTSPEFPMKRLLAAGSGDIYQIAKVYRDGESGRYHNPEFSMLEWYRVGMDHHQLMDEVVELLKSLIPTSLEKPEVQKLSYQALFQSHLQLDPLQASVEQLKSCASKRGVEIDFPLDQDGWLDLLMSHCVMPALKDNQLTLVYDYPASQAALARLNIDQKTAARFEVFWGSLELANGFYELQDSSEQRARFENECARRADLGLPAVQIDERLLQALEYGLPECAGVALGLDRVLMKVSKSSSISEVLAFSTGIA